jgi:hypothetical protein
MAVSSTSSGSLKTGVCLSTDRPDNPFTGQVIFETDTGKVFVWAGSTWVNIGDTSGEGVQLPSGTTAERPSSPTAGQIRFNETTGEPEWYSSVVGDWVTFRGVPIPDLSFTYLVVAGGGGGSNVGYGGGAGGGAGGLRSATDISGTTGTSYTVTVGAGGSSGATPANGSNSVFHTTTSTGGGAAGVNTGTNPNPSGSGSAGGSGGGGHGAYSIGYNGGLGGAGNTPAVSPSQVLVIDRL